jgi:hypothetical protein
LGVDEIASRHPRDDEHPMILMYGEGTGGPPGLNWPAFDAWLGAFLRDPRRADVRQKLDETGAAERHVFVTTSFSTPWEAAHCLSMEFRGLPDRPPSLPNEMTHVWVWNPLERCLTWWPETGWFDPRYRWATA